ncbi:MAG: hypothetical protein IT161_01070 [Bryobacterales bacterium]|nr:hypothetical protein [Bryobacterales bacterium]
MHRRFGRLFGIALVVLIVFLGFGQAVLHLWNWLMPDLFGLRQITYWQSIGLLGLSWILFRGGFLGAPFGPGSRQRFVRERWEKMTPEERERFVRGLDCGAGNRRADPPLDK